MMTRFLVGLSVQTAAFTALIIGPAWAFTGRWDWERGWIAVGFLFLASALGGIWFLATDPGLVRERASVPRPQTRADGLATLLIVVSVVGWFVAIAADTHRLHVLGPLPPSVSFGVGLGVFLIGLAIIVWTLRVNSFAAQVVKVQRAQRVIDTGPYAFVRHPMYSGGIVFFAGIALVLESSAAAIAALPLFVIAFLPRIVIEEATLRRELSGYAEYQSRVHARIVPGLL
jgi:protein-S-isoprenylcysteine O-methyltransferase Ste14